MSDLLPNVQSNVSVSSNASPILDISTSAIVDFEPKSLEAVKQAFEKPEAKQINGNNLDDSKKLFELFSDPTGEKLNPYQRCIDLINVWKNVVISDKTAPSVPDKLTTDQIFCEFLKLPSVERDVDELNGALNGIPDSVVFSETTIRCIQNFIKTKKTYQRLLSRFESGTLDGIRLHPILFYYLVNTVSQKGGLGSPLIFQNQNQPITKFVEYVLLQNQKNSVFIHDIKELINLMQSTSYLSVSVDSTNPNDDRSELVKRIGRISVQPPTAQTSSDDESLNNNIKIKIAREIIDFLYIVVSKSLTSQQMNELLSSIDFHRSENDEDSSSMINRLIISAQEKRVAFILQFFEATKMPYVQTDGVENINYFEWKKQFRYQQAQKLSVERTAHQKLIRGFHALYRRLDKELRVGPFAPTGDEIDNNRITDLATDQGITIVLESFLTALNERDPDRNLIRDLTDRLKNVFPVTLAVAQN